MLGDPRETGQLFEGDDCSLQTHRKQRRPAHTPWAPPHDAKTARLLWGKGAGENSGCPVTFEFWINSEYFLASHTRRGAYG